MFGREQDEGSEQGEHAAGHQGDSGAPPATASVFGNAALDAREQIGGGLDGLRSGLKRIAEAIFERCSSMGLHSLLERGEAALQMGLHRVR